MLFREEFGPVNGLPTRLFFTGPDIGEEFQVEIQPGKVLNIKVLAISNLHPNGQREVFCEMNGQLRTVMVEDKSVTKVGWLNSYSFTIIVIFIIIISALCTLEITNLTLYPTFLLLVFFLLIFCTLSQLLF